MEIAGLGIGVAALYSACIEAVHRVQSYRNFEIETKQLSAQYNADKVILVKWAERVGIREDGLSITHHRSLDDPGVATAVRDVLLSLQTILEATYGARKQSRQDNADHFLTSPESTLAQRSAHATSTSSRKRDKFFWTFGGQEKFAALVDTFGILVGKLDGLIPSDASHKLGLEHMKQSNQLVVNESNQLVKKVLQRFRDQDRTEFMSRIDFAQDDERYESCKACRTRDTCSWIFQRKSFLDWASPDFLEGSPKFLWLHGPAGYGKSVLCAAVIQFLQKDDSFRPVHHFCMPTTQSQENVIAVLKSWLAQMITMEEDLLELALEEMRQSPYQAGKTALWKLFTNLVHHSSGWTFVIDGIDEYQLLDSIESRDTREDRSTFLVNLQKAVVGTLSRILIVSRDEPDIRFNLNPAGAYDDDLVFYEHQISVDDVGADVLAFSRSVVDQRLANKSNDIKIEIAEKMANKCDGMFLWIDLHKRDLRGGKNKRQLQQSIEEMPAGLESIYERNWNDIMRLASSDRLRALGILRWAMFAARPLTFAELTEALLILDDGDHGSLRLDDLPDCIDNEYVTDEISGLCGSLLEVQSTGVPSPHLMTIHLRHFSVRQYLLTKNAQTKLSDEEISVSSHSDIQNNHLAISCLRYLGDEIVLEDMRDQAGKRSFVDYAVQSWYRHVSATGKRYRELNQITNEFFKPNNIAWDLWCSRHQHLSSLNDPGIEFDLQSSPSRIYFAASVGLEETVNYLHSTDPNSINARGGAFGTPMKAAYAAGHVDFSMRLIELGADLNISAGVCGSILGYASSKGDWQICKDLLAKGASLLVTDERGGSPLFFAADFGHMNTTRLLLEHKAEQTVTSRNGWTPVNAACDRGYVDIVKLLLDYGADLSIRNIDGMTPLYSACNLGHVDVVKLLIDYEADVCTTNIDGWTPINAASADGHTEIVKLLLDYGADISIANMDGQIPLYSACLKGSTEIVEILLDHEASVSITTVNGWTPINVACEKGHTDIVKLLIEHGADLSIAEIHGVTPLYSACLGGYAEVARLLLDHKADLSITDVNGWTPLNAACKMGHTNIVKLLLLHGADVCVANNKGRTPLFWACADGHTDIVIMLLSKTNVDISLCGNDGMTPMHVAAKNGLTDIVRLLLEHNADLSLTQEEGYTPLNMATWYGRTDIVRLLLDTNADPGIPNVGGETPLHIASMIGYTDIVRLLLKYNANPEIPNREGWTTLHMASYKGHADIVRLLLECDADSGVPDDEGTTPVISASVKGPTDAPQIFLESGASPFVADNDEETPLCLAAAEGHEEVVRLLLEAGADVNAQWGIRDNPLQAASEQGHEKVVQILLEAGAEVTNTNGEHGNVLQLASYKGHEKVVQMLLEAGAHVNASSKPPFTALFIASLRGYEEVVRLLLQAGADVNAQFDAGDNALQAATDEGHEEVVKLLREAGAVIDDIDALSRHLDNALEAEPESSEEKVVPQLFDGAS